MNASAEKVELCFELLPHPSIGIQAASQPASHPSLAEEVTTTTRQGPTVWLTGRKIDDDRLVLFFCFS